MLGLGQLLRPSDVDHAAQVDPPRSNNVLPRCRVNMVHYIVPAILSKGVTRQLKISYHIVGTVMRLNLKASKGRGGRPRVYTIRWNCCMFLGEADTADRTVRQYQSPFAFQAHNPVQHPSEPDASRMRLRYALEHIDRLENDRFWGANSSWNIQENHSL